MPSRRICSGSTGGHLGIRPDFGLLTRDEDRIAILEDVVRDLHTSCSEPNGDLRNLLRVVDRLLSESYSGRGESSAMAATPDWLPPLFRRYLEFEHVYLIGMAQEVFPSFHALRKGPTSREVEEERRSCFVAITRARETLTLTRSRTYFGYEKRASQFLGEMGIGGRGR